MNAYVILALVLLVAVPLGWFLAMQVVKGLRQQGADAERAKGGQ